MRVGSTRVLGRAKTQQPVRIEATPQKGFFHQLLVDATGSSTVDVATSSTGMVALADPAESDAAATTPTTMTLTDLIAANLRRVDLCES